MKKGVNMRRTIVIATILEAALLAPLCVQAQGTLYVSNLGQTPIGSMAVGSDSWCAQSFWTGTNAYGYTLNSLQLLMDPASVNPGGFTVSIYSSIGNNTPGSRIGNLIGSDPSSGGLFTYAANNLTLSAHTEYFAVVTASTPVAQGAYFWSTANSFGQDFIGPGDPWSIQDFYWYSANGSSWTGTARKDVFQLGVYATPIPEPESEALLGLSLIIFGFWQLRQAK